MLQTIRWLPKRKVIFADSSFGTHELANSISKHGTLISRLRLDANLFDLPPETNKRGRSRIKGEPLPKLTSYLNAADECWTKVTPSHWYGAKEKTLEIISGTGLWYRTGTPPTLLRWVLVRDPAGKMEPQAFFCTDTDMDHPEVISNFAKRWEMEVTFQEVSAPTSELKPNANGQKTRSREPHRHLRSLQSGLSLGAAGFGG